MRDERNEDVPIDGDVFGPEDFAANWAAPRRRLLHHHEEGLRVKAADVAAVDRANGRLDPRHRELFRPPSANRLF